jgi:hypothetical protein
LVTAQPRYGTTLNNLFYITPNQTTKLAKILYTCTCITTLIIHKYIYRDREIFILIWGWERYSCQSWQSERCVQQNINDSIWCGNFNNTQFKVQLVVIIFKSIDLIGYVLENVFPRDASCYFRCKYKSDQVLVLHWPLTFYFIKVN